VHETRRRKREIRPNKVRRGGGEKEKGRRKKTREKGRGKREK